MEEKRFHYAWLIFFSCCVINMVGFGLLINTTGLYFDPVSEAMSLSRSQISMVLLIQTLAAAFTLSFAGKIMDKFDVRKVLTISYLISAFGLISLAYVQNLYYFYFVYLLIGIAQPFTISLSIPLLLGNWFEKKLGFVMGIALGLSAVGGAIFNPLMGSIIANKGWQTGYIVTGIILLVAIIPLTLFIIRSKPSDKGLLRFGQESSGKGQTEEEVIIEDGLTKSEVLKTPNFYLFILACVSLQFVSGFVQHISGHIVNRGMSLTVGGSVISALMLGAAAGKISVGWVLDRVNYGLTIIIYGVIGGLGWLGLIVLPVGNPTLFALSGFLLGIGQGVVLVALPYVVRKLFGTIDYGDIYSSITMFGAFAGAMSGYFGGWMFDHSGGYTISIIINVVLYAIATPAMAIAAQKKIRK